MNNNDIFGANGITVRQIAKDAFNSSYVIGLNFDVDNKIASIEAKIDGLSEVVRKKTSIEELYRVWERLELAEKENKELRKNLAKLNTRVNDLIAEKQVKEFYEKYTCN